jgi:hypothetical protein
MAAILNILRRFCQRKGAFNADRCFSSRAPELKSVGRDAVSGRRASPSTPPNAAVSRVHLWSLTAILGIKPKPTMYANVPSQNLANNPPSAWWAGKRVDKADSYLLARGSSFRSHCRPRRAPRNPTTYVPGRESVTWTFAVDARAPQLDESLPGPASSPLT